MNRDDERRAAAWTQHLGREPGAADGPCLDADDAAGLVEGCLGDDERAAVIGHLATCATCREWIADLDDSIAREAPQAPIVRPLWPRLAAAAAVLIAAGLGWSLFTGAAAPTRATVAAAVVELSAAHPETLGDFTPLALSERDVPPPVERGGLRLVAPRSGLLDDRPSFAWAAVPGAGQYVVTLLTEDGERLFTESTDGTSLAYPAAAPGLSPGTAFVWSVTTRTALGEVRGSVAARLLDAESRKRYEQGSGLIARDAPARMRRLLQAHWAIRADLPSEAKVFLAPGDPPAGGWSAVESETIEFVRRLLGEPDPGH